MADPGASPSANSNRVQVSLAGSNSQVSSNVAKVSPVKYPPPNITTVPVGVCTSIEAAERGEGCGSVVTCSQVPSAGSYHQVSPSAVNGGPVMAWPPKTSTFPTCGTYTMST